MHITAKRVVDISEYVDGVQISTRKDTVEVKVVIDCILIYPDRGVVAVNANYTVNTDDPISAGSYGFNYSDYSQDVLKLAYNEVLKDSAFIDPVIVDN